MTKLLLKQQYAEAQKALNDCSGSGDAEWTQVCSIFLIRHVYMYTPLPYQCCHSACSTSQTCSISTDPDGQSCQTDGIASSSL